MTFFSYLVVSLSFPPLDGEKSFTLAPGRYQLNFSLELPVAIAPSFEGKYGSTRYKVQVKISRTWKMTRKFSRPFHVLPVSNINPVHTDTVVAQSNHIWRSKQLRCGSLSDSGGKHLEQNTKNDSNRLRLSNRSGIRVTRQTFPRRRHHRQCRDRQ